MGSLKDMIASGEATVTPASSSGKLRALVGAGQAQIEPDIQEAAPQVGWKEALVNATTDAIPFGRPLVNLGSTAALQVAKALGVGEPQNLLTDKAKAELAERGMDVPESRSAIPGPLDTYRQVRDERNERIGAGWDQQKWASRAGTGLGIGLSLLAPFPKAKPGIGALGRLKTGAATGGIYGAIQGATHGKADLTRGEFGQFAKDVLGVDGIKRAAEEFGAGNYGRAALQFLGAGALGGAGGGLAAGGLVEGLRPVAGPIKDFAIRKGKDVIQGGSDIASATRKPLPDDVVEEVLKADAMGGTTAETYRRIESQAAKHGAKYAEIVEGLEAQGVTGPEARKLADQLFDRYAQEWPNAPANKAVPQAYFDEAVNVESVAQGSQRLGLKQTEALKQNLQRQARYERLQNNPTEEARQEIASIVRQANEDAIAEAAKAAGPGSQVAQLAEQFVPVKQTLGKMLEARTAAERGVTRVSGRNSGPGITDHLLGASTGNPATAFLTAMASKALRNRAPSMASRYGYGVSEALRTGTATPTAAKTLMLLLGPPDDQERNQALSQALQRGAL